MNIRNKFKEILMYFEPFNKLFTKRFEYISHRTIN